MSQGYRSSGLIGIPGMNLDKCQMDDISSLSQFTYGVPLNADYDILTRIS